MKCFNEKVIGLVGLGYWGKNILRNLHKLGYVYTACDTNLSVISGYKEKFPDVSFTDSFDRVIKCNNIKIVYVRLRNTQNIY
jgi:UDP-2-acetamido-3-amino-2,3-dideoxy-glucuronate N-acetyltransferase